MEEGLTYGIIRNAKILKRSPKNQRPVRIELKVACTRDGWEGRRAVIETIHNLCTLIGTPLALRQELCGFVS